MTLAAKKNHLGRGRRTMDADTAAVEASSWLPWALQAVATLHQRPFHAELVSRQFPPPHDESVLIHAARQLGFRAAPLDARGDSLATLPLPALLRLLPLDSSSFAL